MSSSHTAALDLPRVELRTWQQFLAVAEQLHFGRAARSLHMTQPPLTQAIQKLEERLGVALFERSRRHVALSAAGAALVDPVRTLLLDANKLVAVAGNAVHGSVGVLRLGFAPIVAYGPLPRWLRGFRAAHPGITLQLRELTWDAQRDALARAEIDAALIPHATGIPAEIPSEFNRLGLMVEPFMLALPTSLAAQAFTLRTAMNMPLVMFPRPAAPSLYDAVLAMFHGRGVAPTIAQEATQLQTIVNLVAAELGFALVPRVMTELRRRGVSYRAIPRALAARPPRCQTSLVWGRTATPITQRFVDHVRSALSGG